MRKNAAMSDALKAEYEKQMRRIKRFVRAAQKRGYDFPDSVIPKHPKVITEASIRKVAGITPDTLYKKATYEDKETGETISGLEGRKKERQAAAVKAAETRARKAGKPYVPKPQVSKPRPGRVKKKSTKYKPAMPKAGKDKKKKKGKKGEKPKGEKKSKKSKKKTPREKFYEGSDLPPSEDGEPVDREDQVIGNVLEVLEEMIATWAPLPNWTDALIKVKEADKNVAKNLLESAIAQQGRTQIAMNCEKHANEIVDLLQEILYGSGSKEGNFKDGRTQVNFDLVRFQALLLDRTTTTAEENVYLVDLINQFYYEDVDEDVAQFREAQTSTLPKTGKSKYNPQSYRRQGEKSETVSYKNQKPTAKTGLYDVEDDEDFDFNNDLTYSFSTDDDDDEE